MDDDKVKKCKINSNMSKKPNLLLKNENELKALSISKVESRYNKPIKLYTKYVIRKYKLGKLHKVLCHKTSAKCLVLSYKVSFCERIIFIKSS